MRRVEGTGRFAAMAAALTLAACGGGGGEASVTESASSIDVDGVLVQIDSRAPFTQARDFPARLETTIAAALRYWGGTWGQVQGRTITFVDAPSITCGTTQALGCFADGIRLTTRDPGVGMVACVEQTVLVHEIGHLVLGDPMHTDPRWMQMDTLAAELGGGTGYSSSGETSCTAYASVWQHPLDAP
jgi:hypothetical protein